MWLEVSNQLDEVIEKMNTLMEQRDRLIRNKGKIRVLSKHTPNRIKEIETELESLEALKNELEDQLMRKMKGLEPADLAVINHFLQEMNEERFILDADLYDTEDEELFNKVLLRLCGLGILLPAIRNGEPGYVIIDDNSLSVKMFGEDLTPQS